MSDKELKKLASFANSFTDAVGAAFKESGDEKQKKELNTKALQDMETNGEMSIFSRLSLLGMDITRDTLFSRTPEEETALAEKSIEYANLSAEFFGLVYSDPQLAELLPEELRNEEVVEQLEKKGYQKLATLCRYAPSA